jgi:DNA-binding winged helix-turn-helix (wHTH) protein
LGPAAYRFGPFLVDRAGYRVLEGDRQVELAPRLLDLLLHLLDNAGALVTKEDLLEALWPGANVTDNALTQAVSELRQALGDEASAPRYIKTVARRGYRFVAPVESSAAAAAPPTATAASAPEGSLAVLDFANVTGDESAAWLSAGIAETVSADLRALGRFRVVDRWRVTEAARRAGGALHELAASLQVRLVVVGGFQRTADRVRITARVVDVFSGEAVADAKVDGRLDDIFDLQDQVAAQFARELGAPAAGKAQPHSRETSSLEAYRAVMEGWLRVESLDVRELPAAIADFERAVAIDPKYALAYTSLASAEFASYESTRADVEPAKALLDRAIAHGRQAVALDDTLAEAHGALALILVSAWDTPAAIREARRAVALEPGNWRHLFRLGHASWGEDRLRAAEATLALYPDFAFAYFQSAMVHVARGHLTEAERVLRHGAAIQDRQIGRGERYPALGLHWLLGLVRLAHDDVAEAIQEFDRECGLAQPHRLYGREYTMHASLARGAALLRMRREREAMDSFLQAHFAYPDLPLVHAGLALAEADGADWTTTESTAAMLTRARPMAGTLARGIILAARGEAEAAAGALRQVLDQAPPGFAGWWLPVEPFMRQVIDNKEVRSVLARVAERAS